MIFPRLLCQNLVPHSSEPKVCLKWEAIIKCNFGEVIRAGEGDNNRQRLDGLW